MGNGETLRIYVYLSLRWDRMALVDRGSRVLALVARKNQCQGVR